MAGNKVKRDERNNSGINFSLTLKYPGEKQSSAIISGQINGIDFEVTEQKL